MVNSNDNITKTIFTYARTYPLHNIEDVEQADPTANISITCRTKAVIAQVFARKGQAKKLAEKLHLPEKSGKSLIHDGITAIAMAPDQWMIYTEQKDQRQFITDLENQAGDLGHVSDQSHGRIIIHLTGQKARCVMAKGCRLDLHPMVTSVGFCGQTQIAQIGVMIHQTAEEKNTQPSAHSSPHPSMDDLAGYDLLVFSGFAESFYHWLEEASAEFSKSIE